MKLWHCNECGKEWKTEDPVVEIHFHACPPRRTRTRRPVELLDPEYPSLEERWHAIFADAYGGYKPPTPEEARTETGEHGRRKDGTGRRELEL